MAELGFTLKDLYAEIRLTSIIWGWLEGEMLDAKVEWQRPPPPTANEALVAFMTDLAQP